jgi:hypothetical protein
VLQQQLRVTVSVDHAFFGRSLDWTKSRKLCEFWIWQVQAQVFGFARLHYYEKDVAHEAAETQRIEAA